MSALTAKKASTAKGMTPFFVVVSLIKAPRGEIVPKKRKGLVAKEPRHLSDGVPQHQSFQFV
jgi:hypothetical protein